MALFGGAARQGSGDTGVGLAGNRFRPDQASRVIGLVRDQSGPR